MRKRLFDIVTAVVGLVLAAPLLAAAAVGIRWTSPGPLIYRARRIGWRGRPFTMYKLRTMHWDASAGRERITGVQDPRVFPFGKLLRQTKIDELPQLVNVLRGEMSVVGPRPEEPLLVERYYNAAHWRTLDVRPGLASPGALYQYTHGHRFLVGGAPETMYARKLLPVKLALDLVYLRRASFWYDLTIIARTLATIAAIVVGRRKFRDPPEMLSARRLVAPIATHKQPILPALLLNTALLLAVACRLDGPDRPPDAPPLGNLPAPLLVGAGDIARCGDDADEATAAILDTLPGTVFTTGDNAYPDGSPEDYANCYAESWGRHRDRTRPVPGNHEYHTADAAGYFEYFGAAAGEPGQGYYSYDVGEWHIIALNSELDMGEGSAQLAWLREDLAANSRFCLLAYWHHPRFSSGTTHGNSTRSDAVWQVLYDAGADIVLNGHEHNYERFAPQDPAGAADATHGIRQFVVGTGGSTSYDFGNPVANSEVRIGDTSGVLALSLQPDDYEWRFIPVAGPAADAGTGECHASRGATVPPAPADVVGGERVP